MPKIVELEPRFTEVKGEQVWLFPKGYVFLGIKRRKSDGTLRIIVRKLSNAKKKATKTQKARKKEASKS